MKDMAINHAVSMVNWLTGLPGRIMSAIGNLGSLLLNAGRDLLTGLWNGISGAASWLKSQIASFFGSLLPQWAKDFLGIRSPSKVFADIGKYIPEGMALGIDHNVGSVKDSVANMTDAAANVTVTGRRSSSGASGGVRVTFNGNTSDALATVFMQMVRSGKIQLKAA